MKGNGIYYLSGVYSEGQLIFSQREIYRLAMSIKIRGSPGEDLRKFPVTKMSGKCWELDLTSTRYSLYNPEMVDQEVRVISTYMLYKPSVRVSVYK